MAARYAAARAVRQLASAAPRRASPFVCQRWQPAQIERRLFSVSSALKEKKYTEDHEWIETSADGKTVTLGISEYAAKALGDVVYIELPEVGLEVGAGEVIGAVESVKSASDILTPIGAKVVEINGTLEKTPGNINKDPEGDAWIAKLEPTGEPEGKIMSKKEYDAFTEDA
ncbi:glycine cleavage H-protein-domain-containing protein [Lophiotrema nucula]|uniref:Glycine cleavage system H protein n=1 Tax=Lophiotrema nucula TaxID=690887 RepID=A0A6A5Z0N5_9PLEO|nr:glycine cleavage H-protein-domain-containing protein [Lophiotrema nucula]